MKFLLRLIERLLWCSGFVLVSVFLAHLGLAELERMNAVAAFKNQQSAGMAIGIAELPTELPGDEPAITTTVAASGEIATLDYEPATPDQSLWSTGQIARFAASLEEETSPVLGVFSIPRFGFEAPLYDGASELHMTRGIARIDGTAMPGHAGNLGIAGHRDGYFRVLQDIRFGDELTLTTAAGTQTYRVQQLMIVEPSEVDVLRKTRKSSITLVTCYPFYYVGHAPERFIVRAVLQD